MADAQDQAMDGPFNARLFSSTVSGDNQTYYESLFSCSLPPTENYDAVAPLYPSQDPFAFAQAGQYDLSHPQPFAQLLDNIDGYGDAMARMGNPQARASSPQAYFRHHPLDSPPRELDQTLSEADRHFVGIDPFHPQANTLFPQVAPQVHTVGPLDQPVPPLAQSMSPLGTPTGPADAQPFRPIPLPTGSPLAQLMDVLAPQMAHTRPQMTLPITQNKAVLPQLCRPANNQPQYRLLTFLFRDNPRMYTCTNTPGFAVDKSSWDNVVGYGGLMGRLLGDHLLGEAITQLLLVERQLEGWIVCGVEDFGHADGVVQAMVLVMKGGN
jgi:hypothetical protein